MLIIRSILVLRQVLSSKEVIRVQYIVIVGTPPGEAPLWVREEWVGLALPVKEIPPEEEGEYVAVGVLGGPPENQRELFFTDVF